MKDESQKPDRTWKRWISNCLIKVHYSQLGWWIVDDKGYKNNLPLSYCFVESDGYTVRRITFFKFCVEWGFSKNEQKD